MNSAGPDEPGRGHKSRSWRLLRTWLPTALGSSVLVVEIPLVAASVARSKDGADALAALGIAVAVIVVLNTPGLAMAPLVVTEAGYRPQRHLGRYGLAVGAASSLVLAALSSWPAAYSVLQALVNVNHSLSTDVRGGLLALAPASVAVAGRRYLHGRLIFAQQTRAITVATMVRICCSGGAAWTWLAVDPTAGAMGGGFSLTIGAFVEFTVLAVACRRVPALPEAPAGTLRGLVSRHAQLSSALLLNMVPALITTAGITHSRQPVPSLVAWPALYGLLSLFTGPTLDWESVTATALRRLPGEKAPQRLTVWLAAGFLGLFAAVMLSPAGYTYVSDFIGVPSGPAHLGLTWGVLLIPAPALAVWRSYARGQAIAGGRTSRLVYASAADVVVLVTLSTCLSFSWLPGVACGSIAIVAGTAIDAAVTSERGWLVPLLSGLSGPRQPAWLAAPRPWPRTVPSVGTGNPSSLPGAADPSGPAS
jgi:hypothetical protein